MLWEPTPGQPQNSWAEQEDTSRILTQRSVREKEENRRCVDRRFGEIKTNHFSKHVHGTACFGTDGWPMRTLPLQTSSNYSLHPTHSSTTHRHKSDSRLALVCPIDPPLPAFGDLRFKDSNTSMLSLALRENQNVLLWDYIYAYWLLCSRSADTQSGLSIFSDFNSKQSVDPWWPLPLSPHLFFPFDLQLMSEPKARWKSFCFGTFSKNSP